MLVFWFEVKRKMALFKKLITSGKHAKLSSLYKTIKDKKLRRQRSKDEIVPWLNERIQVSSRPVQFGIPGDIRAFQSLTIDSYLEKFCKIPHERMVVFRRIFKKFKYKDTNVMLQKNLVPAILSLLYNCVTAEEVNGFLGKMRLRFPEQTFDLQTFARIAAVAERVLYLSYAEAAGNVPLGVLRTFQECTDFSSLEWRLKDLQVNPGLKRLLMSL